MRLIILVTAALTVVTVTTPCAAQTQSDSTSDSVAVVILLNRVQAPFGIQYAGARSAVSAALHRSGIVVVRTSPRVITVEVSAQVIPPLAGVFPDYLEPFLEEVEWSVSASYVVRGTRQFPTRRLTKGRSFIGTWAAEATTGVRNAVRLVVSAHAQRALTLPRADAWQLHPSDTGGSTRTHGGTSCRATRT